MGVAELFGIIRPRMFAQLKEVRSLIEHHDRTPPAQERCAELAEFVWYFLRSTDNLVQLVPMNILFRDEDPYALSVEGGPEHAWCFTISGGSRIPREFLSATEEREWFEVKDAQIRPDPSSEGVRLQGTMTGPSALIRRLVEAFFETGR